MRLVALKQSESETDKATTTEYVAARARFEATLCPPVQLAVFPVAGVVMDADGYFRWALSGTEHLSFNVADSLRFVWRIDAVAEQARDLWRTPLAADGKAKKRKKAKNTADEKGAEKESGPDGALSHRARLHRARVAIERQAHLERAYGLMTVVFAGMSEAYQRIASNSDEREPAIAELERTLQVLRPEIRRAEKLLSIAAQRDAQVRYGRGMLLGTIALTALCAAIGAVLWWREAPAWWAAPLLTGAIGALVSVLQRMTSGRMKLDAFAGEAMLKTYGAVRPAIGGVLGMALLALLEGGILVEVATDSKLAFYSAVGFLAGFNERFAQDMLVGSARRLTDQFGGSDEGGDANGGEAAAARRPAPGA